MPCQVNPKTYSIVVRCPLEDGAKLKTLADDAGLTLSAYIASIVKNRVEDRALNAREKAWYEAHYNANLDRRMREDEKSALGYYKKKRRGRPRKPGPRSGKHKKVALPTLSLDKGGCI